MGDLSSSKDKLEWAMNFIDWKAGGKPPAIGLMTGPGHDLPRAALIVLQALRAANEPCEGYAGDSVGKLLADMRKAVDAARSNKQPGVAAFVAQWVERLESFTTSPPAVPSVEPIGTLNGAPVYSREDVMRLTAALVGTIYCTEATGRDVDGFCPSNSLSTR